MRRADRINHKVHKSFDILPHEGAMIVRRVTEIIDLVSVFTKLPYYIWEILISPTAGNIGIVI